MRGHPRLLKEVAEGGPSCLTDTTYAVVLKNGSGRTSAVAEGCRVIGAVTCQSKPMTVKVFELDVPPPGAGLNTVMLRWPMVRMSVSEICAVSCVELTKVVGRGEPSTCTTDPLMNPDPLTVRVKLGPNTTTVDGEMLEIEGTGLLTVNVSGDEAPPPGAGVKTVIDNKAPTARSDAGMAAVS